VSKSLSDSKALLNNLLNGSALPEHLSKPRSEGLDRKALAVKISENLRREPLIAVCFEHTCRCKRSWKSFGFYARKTQVDVPGQGRTEVTKRLPDGPQQEPVTQTFWQPVEEPVCINCFDAATNIATQEAANG